MVVPQYPHCKTVFLHSSSGYALRSLHLGQGIGMQASR